MKHVNKISNIFLLLIMSFSINLSAQNNCENPLSLDWLQFSLGDPCVEGIYAFEYNDEPYVYVVSKPNCIAADARNTLYNCANKSFCYYFGFTMPQDQCDESLIDAIAPLLNPENRIYPLSISRTCENPLELTWVKESLKASCTDGIYAFEYNGASYIYRSTACEYVDDPNRLYNCADKSYCFVDGKTLPQDQCDLTEFPLENYLINENLIWSSPLLRLIPDYQWLTAKVDLRNCDDVQIKEFKTTNATYLSIKNKNTTELYAQNGSLLCTNANNFNCETAYGLTTPNEEWACNARIDEVCGIDEPLDSLPWLQALIDEADCTCNTSIRQYCYNGAVYFDSSPISPICADYPGFVTDVEGNVICQNGGITGGDCHQIIPDFFETAEKISTVWSCDGDNTGCETLQFASINSGCECCNDIILFEITGGDGNYEVSTLNGEVIINGMSTASLPVGINELIVTDGQDCSAKGIFENFPICCEVPPVCEGLQISYNCTNGLLLNGYGDCNSIAVKDIDGNIYNEGDLLADGSYTLIEAYEGQVTPACSSSTINVNCNDASTCSLPPDSGPCEAYIPRFYYDNEALECLQFIYGGCQGNENNYETYEICTDACGYNYTCPSIEDPLEELAWLQKIAQNANGCSVNQIIQFTYNENIYFQTTPSFGGGFCPADLPLQYYNCDGLRICSLGFSPFPTCNQAMVNAANENGKIIWTYGYDNNDCNNLQFDYIVSECGPCCDETLNYAISGGDGNYEVATTEGIAVYNGMPLNSPYLGFSFTLIVTDGQDCTAEQDFIHYPFCCEVPPICFIDELTYDCTTGLQVIGQGECNYNATFTDEAGNSYEPGSVLSDGNYTLNSGGHPISPSCAAFELTVSCENNSDYCDFEDVVITSDSEVCGLGIVDLTTNDVFGDAGPDDNEIVFVKVFGDNTFEVLDDSNIYDSYPCYYAVAFRWSCEAPDFYTNDFGDIVNNAGKYKVSECFTLNSISPPEYEITTEPYCSGEGLFTVGVTINGGSGSYNLGIDYTGETIFGETGENLITYAGGKEFYSIAPYDATTGCGNDYVYSVSDPGCGSLNICELPMVVGPCEALIPRYYYDADQADCIEFNYGGCNGNANNFETYTACIEACGTNCSCDDVYEPVCGIDGVTYDNACHAQCQGVEVDYDGECSITELNCPPDDPLQWAWMQNLIVEYGGCLIAEVRTFTYQGTQHFVTFPGYPSNLTCFTDAPQFYYNCEGKQVCELGFFTYGQPNHCNDDIINAASNSTTIWTYNETNCTDPFELEMVKQAIENETCTEGIYAFDFEGEFFVYVQGLCDRFVDGPSDALYNCNTGLTCLFSYEIAFSDACDELFNKVSYLINEENLIWRPNDSCICPAVYEPVCGVDGLTYGNECEAACEGVEVAYEGECSVELNCLQGDPLEWIWIQNLIAKYGGCLISEIRTFTYQGTQHFVTHPGYPPNLFCATDAPSTYYNCEGEFVCETGFLPPDSPTFCKEDILLADNNAVVIWSYNDTNCADPLELELVQNAIADETCTGDIYAFDFEGESFVFIKTLCEFIDAGDVLYNCNTGLTCAIVGETIYVEACYQRFDQISNLINDENLIWTKPCAYETKGTVRDFTGLDGCSFVIELDDGSVVEPAKVPDNFDFVDGQQVEFTYRNGPYASICQVGPIVDIICIRAIEEPCVCDADYTPVCGVDGNTYSNACVADCEGVAIAYEGECEEDCICPEYYQPVCGIDGITYDNPCFAECEGVVIAYDGMCSNNDAIFDRFTWLSNLADPVFCANGLTITEYSWFNAYSFIYIQYPEAAGELYYQDGTYYCTDAQGYNCLSIYSLTDVVNTWTCSSDGGPNDDLVVNLSDDIICNEDGTFSIKLTVAGGSGNFGVYHTHGEGQPDFISFNEGDTTTFSGNVIDATDGLFKFFVYDENLADAPAKMLTVDVSSCLTIPAGDLFNQYNWLSNIVDENDCTPGYSIDEYDFGTYSFIYVQTGNTASLYLGDGTMYCTDANGYSCVDLYGFSNPSSNTACNNLIDCPDVLEPVCGIDGNTYDNACWAERAGVAVAYDGTCANVELFNQYPWLNTLMDPSDCSNDSGVSEYDLGGYSFIFIQHNGEGSLYLNDGTFYCSDELGYICTAAYGLGEATSAWNCGNPSVRKDKNAYLAFDETFKVYPNPNHGQFKLELLGEEDIDQTVNIISIDGQLMKLIEVTDKQFLIDVNLQHLPKGIYLIELQSGQNIKTQKIIIH